MSYRLMSMSEMPSIKMIEKRIQETFIKTLPCEDSEFVPYGTAGFRANADKIRPLLHNIALVAALRTFLTDSDTGIMITASHNPVQDNGVKIVGDKGEMLDPEWESMMENFVNQTGDKGLEITTRFLQRVSEQVYSALDIDDPIDRFYHGRIYIGRDTRPSSEDFVRLIKQSLDESLLISSANRPEPDFGYIGYIDLGVVTTPALHYVTAKGPKPKKYMICPGQAPPHPSATISVIDYYRMLLDGFVALNDNGENPTTHLYDHTSLVIDCANGVGMKTMQYLLADARFNKFLPAALINTSSSANDVLNHECGADFVKTKLLPPRGANQTDKRYASFDGDADRLVYFYLQDSSDSTSGDKRLQLKLVDGDKILVLFVKYLQDILKKYELTDKLTLGVVQTAYANGGSTDYLREKLGVANLDCVDTGVKNLHKKVVDYDLGVYFEANGHGSIWISKKAENMLNGCTELNSTPVKEMQQIMSILNNYTGDAVSDLLIVETILKHYDWDIKEWYNMYSDRPNSLIKVVIADRNSVVSTDAGRKCLKPEGLQTYIDKLVNEFGPGSRCFVRASGTENAIRVYSEAKDQESADKLSRLVGDKVSELCSLPEMIDKLTI